MWLEFAQAMVADDLPAAAARALRVRLTEKPEFESGAMQGAMARITVILDAETAFEAGPNNPDAGRTQAELSMALLHDLDKRNNPAAHLDTPERIDLAGGIYEASVLYTLVELRPARKRSCAKSSNCGRTMR